MGGDAEGPRRGKAQTWGSWGEHGQQALGRAAAARGPQGAPRAEPAKENTRQTPSSGRAKCRPWTAGRWIFLDDREEGCSWTGKEEKVGPQHGTACRAVGSELCYRTTHGSGGVCSVNYRSHRASDVSLHGFLPFGHSPPLLKEKTFAPHVLSETPGSPQEGGGETQPPSPVSGSGAPSNFGTAEGPALQLVWPQPRLCCDQCRHKQKNGLNFSPKNSSTGKDIYDSKSKELVPERIGYHTFLVFKKISKQTRKTYKYP